MCSEASKPVADLKDIQTESDQYRTESDLVQVRTPSAPALQRPLVRLVPAHVNRKACADPALVYAPGRAASTKLR